MREWNSDLCGCLTQGRSSAFAGWVDVMLAAVDSRGPYLQPRTLDFMLHDAYQTQKAWAGAMPTNSSAGTLFHLSLASLGQNESRFPALCGFHAHRQDPLGNCVLLLTPGFACQEASSC